MGALHVRNVPESLIVALRERAERHGHSIQQEVLQILEAAAAEPEKAPETRASGAFEEIGEPRLPQEAREHYDTIMKIVRPTFKKLDKTTATFRRQATGRLARPDTERCTIPCT